MTGSWDFELERQIIEDHPWDIIIFQQSIGFDGEGNYSSYKDDFKTLREAIIKLCQEKHGKTPLIGWNMFWGYNSNKSTAKDIDATSMYNAIVSATKEMNVDTGIDIIIPTGTALQNARNALDSNWRTASNYKLFTKDGYHTCFGIGNYVLACTWFQYLIAPIYNVSLIDNKARPTAYDISFDTDVVDDSNVSTIWKCVKDACRTPYTETSY